MKNNSRVLRNGLGHLLMFAVGLQACASAPKQSNVSEFQSVPAWVNNPQGRFSETQYLTSVGTGSTRDVAIDDAKKQLAESFIVKVKSETSAKGESSLNENTGGSVSGESNQKTSKNLSLQTETYLRGAEVKEITKVGSDYYALVALDKLKARSGLVMEANRLKSKLSNDLDSLDTVYTSQKMAEAKTDLADLQELYGEAAALGMSALIEVQPLEARLNRIEQKVRGKNANLAFAVKMVKGEEFFESDLQSCINDHGGAVFTVASAPANAHKVEISLVERPQHQQIEGWERIRFDVTASVVANTGRLYRIQTTQTETGRSRSAILESVADKLSQDLCDQLFKRMSEVQ